MEHRYRAENVRVPPHVVFRHFAAETVVLNLETGLYHGLNPTAGRMLEALIQEDSFAEAARSLSGELDVAQAILLDDLTGLVDQLLERGLIVVEGLDRDTAREQSSS